MKQRCNNPKHTAARWYHAKGIRVCDEWNRDFKAFQAWARENGYFDKGSIDRIDPAQGYTPENCRWVTIEENRRRAGGGKKHEGRSDKDYRKRRRTDNKVTLCNCVRTQPTEIDRIVETSFSNASMLLPAIIDCYLAGKEAGYRKAKAEIQPETAE